MSREYSSYGLATYDKGDDFHSFRNLEWINNYYLPVVKEALIKKGSILDIGSGNGRMFPLLKQHFGRVVGIDPFEKVHPYYMESCDYFEATEFQDFKSSEKFDVLLFNQVIALFFRFIIPTPTVEEIVSKIDELLKKDGEVHIIEWPTNNSRNPIDFYDEEWTTVLNKYNLYVDFYCGENIDPNYGSTVVIIIKRK